MRLRRTMVALGIGALAAFLPLVAPAAPARAAADPQAAEQEFVSRINALRSGKGLAPLRVDGELTAIARRWAAHMAEVGEISHNPNFSKQVTANWVKLGENVGMGPEVGRIHNAFVASPSHYRNLVDGEFELIGVGVVVAADGTLFTSHQFERLAPSSAAAASAAAPAPAPAPRSTRAARPVAAAQAAAVPAAPAAVPAAPAVPVVPPRPVYAVEVLETLRTF